MVQTWCLCAPCMPAGRNVYFKGNGFMGPTLYKPSSFGLTFQVGSAAAGMTPSTPAWITWQPPMRSAFSLFLVDPLPTCLLFPCTSV